MNDDLPGIQRAPPTVPVILIGVLVIAVTLSVVAVNNARGSAAVVAVTTTRISPSATPTSLVSASPSRPPSPSATMTNTATPTNTPTPTHTYTATATSTPSSPTATPTSTPWPTPDGDARLREVHVPILMYHHVGPLPEEADPIRIGLTIEPDVFRQQLQYLRDLGYESISLYDLQYALALDWPLPEKPVVFTFDDGYRDNYEYAFPIMAEYGYTGTVFVVTQFMDEGYPEYVNWRMAEEMASAGWRIEPHTKTHVELTGQVREFIIYQLLGSMQTVEAHVGYQPRFLSYPGGKYDDEVIGILEEIGFWGAVTVDPAQFHRLENAYTWGRVRVSGHENIIDLALRLGAPTPTYTPTPTETPEEQ